MKTKRNSPTCPKCHSDNVYYDAEVSVSRWCGGREISQKGLYICLNCDHVWRSPEPKPEAAEG